MGEDEYITVRIKVTEEKWKSIKRMAVEKGESVQEFVGDLIEIGASELSESSERLVEIEEPNTKELIEITNLEEYEKALKALNPKLRYSWEDEGKNLDGKSTDLISYEEGESLMTIYDGFLHQGVLHRFYIPGKFSSLQAYQRAINEGFKGYDTILYNILKEHGFSVHSDFEKARGEYDVYNFIKILKIGYTGHEDYDKDAGSLSIDEWGKWCKFGFIDSKEVEEAKKIGFIRSGWGGGEPKTDDIDEFRNAKKGGFNDFGEYRKATEKGFSVVKEWGEFKKTDFSTRDEFLKGKELGINDSETVRVYLFLASFPPGRAIAINKVVDGTNVYEDDLEKIFRKTPIKKLGRYDGKGGTFIRSKTIAYPYRCIIIDGSNVATDTEEVDGKEVKKGYIWKLEVVMKKAEETGLPVYVYVTASLKHRIDDRKQLLEYIKKKKIIETTGKSEDDKFFLQAGLEKDGFIITNDFLRQYKEAHPDKADEIENRRVPYNFHDKETVHFGGKLSKIKNGAEVGNYSQSNNF